MTLFRERQQFRQRWLWLLFALVSVPILALLGYAVYQQIVLDQPFGIHPASDTELVLVSSTVFVLHTTVIALFWFARLDVEVTKSELSIRFRPFHLRPRRIALQTIVDARARHGDANGEAAYRVSGDEAVQLTLADGKRMLIGSRRSAELEAAIRSALSA